LSERDARATIRFSFGRDTTEQDVDRGAEAFARAVAWSRV